MDKSVEVEVFSSESEILKKYPQAKPADKTHIDDGKATYEFGERVQGDKLMVGATDVYNAPTRQDVALKFNFPGKVPYSVTYASVEVLQDSEVGQAFIVSGGIGQSEIHLAVVADKIKQVQYTYEIYAIVYV
ncbi:uncharacterized protein LOC113368160 isoform X2 [Ctenocephalides felis]|uniref:uncharacterized protein LOC113365755 isoform X2 n=1 Tax=Ctenocephalides felis TaxID=7515 RepID=UPI000E6E52A1|nr:uncharacterized protein LOC113365755 isoform X2 [Ctenocephalides felis]XP_026465516.1 uncharacterized protein LOC113368160 isoform X2 [Ctenocephalides felis]